MTTSQPVATFPLATVLYTTAVASLILAVFHAVVQTVWHTPVGLLNLHFVITLLLPFAGWRAEWQVEWRTWRQAQTTRRKIPHKKPQNKKALTRGDGFDPIVQQFRATGE